MATLAPSTTALSAGDIAYIADNTAAQLGAILSTTPVVHHRPMGTAVDACTWCDLSTPEPAVVQFAHTDVPDACLWCACTAARHAIEAAERDTDADRIAADVCAIEAATVLSEDVDPPMPGVTVLTDSDGTRISLATNGIEIVIGQADRFGTFARLDLSTREGRTAADALRNALDAALFDCATAVTR